MGTIGNALELGKMRSMSKCLFLGVVVLVAASCGGGKYDVEVSFGAGVDANAIARIELLLVEGACPMPAEIASGAAPTTGVVERLDLARAATPYPRFGHVAPGAYGLYARGVNAACNTVAAACVPVELDGDGGETLSVILETSANVGACAATDVCNAGECIPTSENVAIQVGAGRAHSCALMTSQKIWCWGDNAFGQLGQGDTNPRTSPVEIVSTVSWQSLSVGWDHVCAIDVDDRLFCWGRSDDGRLGHDRGDQRLPVQVGSRDDWAIVSASARTTCGHADNTTFCWGANEVGQLGVGDTNPRATPTEVAGNDIVEDYSLAAGGNDTTGHVAFIERDPVIIVFQTWVLNTAGAGLAGGDRSTPDNDGSTWLPSAIVRAGGEHTCVLQSGHLYCGGVNTTRQLGRDDTTTPAEVGSDDDWTQVSAGSRHTCGRRGTAIYCWGDNTSGQTAVVGNPIDTPTRVGTDDGWTDIASGVDHTCAIRGGLVFCWGSNASNQSGLGVGAPGQNTPADFVVFP